MANNSKNTPQIGPITLFLGSDRYSLARSDKTDYGCRAIPPDKNCIGQINIICPLYIDLNRIYADIVNHKHEIKAAICFWHAKKKRGAEDFSTVANALPGIDSLMDSAPQSSALTEKLGSSVPSLGGKASSAAGIASLTESFSKLGLDNKMVNEYVTVILDYAKSEGGETVMNLLKGALL